MHNRALNPEWEHVISNSIRIFVVSLFAIGLLGLGACSKDGGDKKCGDKAASTKEADKPKSDGPTKEEVAKIDCDKACKQQGECQKGASKHAGTEKAIKMCVSGCKMTKTNYDPKKMGFAAKMLVKWNAGKCK